MMLNRRSLAALAAALMLGGPALAATPQPMTGTWVKIALAGTGQCVTVSTSDASSQTMVTTSASQPGVSDQGAVVQFFKPVSAYISADLWAKGPAGSTVGVDLGLCGTSAAAGRPGGGSGGGGGSLPVVDSAGVLDFSNGQATTLIASF